MKKIITMVIALLLIGCKGKDGKDGTPGASANITNYVGTVSANSVSYSIPEITADSEVSVYVSNDNIHFVQLPYTITRNVTVDGITIPQILLIHFVAQIGGISIVNALDGELPNYKIVIINPGTVL